MRFHRRPDETSNLAACGRRGTVSQTRILYFYPPTHNREPYDTPPRSTRESRKEAVHRIDVFREFVMRLQKNYRLPFPAPT